MGRVHTSDYANRHESYWTAFVGKLSGLSVYVTDTPVGRTILRTLPPTITRLKVGDAMDLVPDPDHLPIFVLPSTVRVLQMEPVCPFSFSSPWGLDTLVLENVDARETIRETRPRTLEVHSVPARVTWVELTWPSVERLEMHTSDHVCGFFPNLRHLLLDNYDPDDWKDTLDKVTHVTLTSTSMDRIYRSLHHLRKLKQLQTVYHSVEEIDSSPLSFSVNQR